MVKLIFKRPSVINHKYGYIVLGFFCGWFVSRVLHSWPGHSSSPGWSAPVNRSATNLTESVRVLCWVMTTPDNHKEKVVHQQATWGARCNKLLVMSSVADPAIGSIALPVEEGRKGLWNKTREAFRYIYEQHLEEYDWFLKADDDTYVVMENLRYFLHAYTPQMPIYFGSKFRYPDYVKQGYFSGGAGYVLSREALRRFYEQGLLADEDNCSKTRDVEDLEMGKCMESSNVTAGDSRDELGRKRFLPMEPAFHLTSSVTEDPGFWYNQYSYYGPAYGKNCCSDLAISFHYVPGKHMYMMDYLIYELHPWGIRFDSPPLPREKSLPEALSVAGPYPISTIQPVTDASATEEEAITVEESSNMIPVST